MSEGYFMCKNKSMGGRCNGYLNKNLAKSKKAVDDRLNLMFSSGVLAEKTALDQASSAHWSEYKRAKEAGDKVTAAVAKEKAMELKEPLKEARSKLNLFKDETAKLVMKYDALQTERDRRDGKFTEYTDDTLGNARKTVTFPSNSPEWHAQRAKAIGGSDVGSIMGVSPYTNREKILKDKTEATAKAKVEEKAYPGGAFFRGDAWEGPIARMYAEKNPDKKVMHCKSSWVNNERDYQQANVDGLICENGSETPNAILEIKTSSVGKDWDKGVPEHYRLQTLWYMDTFNMKKAYVAVLIDDHDYRQFEVTPKPGEMENIRKEMSLFMEDVKERKAQLKAAA